MVVEGGKKVLIETYWNVKTVILFGSNDPWKVLIETYWNVKMEYLDML